MLREFMEWQAHLSWSHAALYLLVCVLSGVISGYATSALLNHLFERRARR